MGICDCFLNADGRGRALILGEISLLGSMLRDSFSKSMAFAPWGMGG
jgi:hypothetical protein